MGVWFYSLFAEQQFVYELYVCPCCCCCCLLLLLPARCLLAACLLPARCSLWALPQSPAAGACLACCAQACAQVQGAFNPDGVTPRHYGWWRGDSPHIFAANTIWVLIIFGAHSPNTKLRVRAHAVWTSTQC